MRDNQQEINNNAFNDSAEEFESIKQFDSALKTPDGSCLKHPTGVNYMTSRSAVKHSKITWLRYARAKAAMTIKISSVMIVTPMPAVSW